MWVWLSSFAVFVALFGFEAVRMADGHDPVIKGTSNSATGTTQSSTAQPSTTEPNTTTQSGTPSQDYTPTTPPSSGSS